MGQVIPPLNGAKGGKGAKGKAFGGKGGYAVPPPNQMPGQEPPQFQQAEMAMPQQPGPVPMPQQPGAVPLSELHSGASPQKQQQYLPPVETNPYALAIQAGWSRDEVLLMQ